MLFLINDNYPTATAGGRLHVASARNTPSLIATPAVIFGVAEVATEKERQIHTGFAVLAILPNSAAHCVYVSPIEGKEAENDCADVMRQIDRATAQALADEDGCNFVDLRGAFMSDRERKEERKKYDDKATLARDKKGDWYAYDVDGERFDFAMCGSIGGSAEDALREFKKLYPFAVAEIETPLPISNLAEPYSPTKPE